MLNLEDIDKAIIELASHDASYATCERLAWLYIVKDHMAGAAKYAPKMAGSEFKEAASNCPIDILVNTIDEHMACVKAVYPKEYDRIIEALKDSAKH